MSYLKLHFCLFGALFVLSTIEAKTGTRFEYDYPAGLQELQDSNRQKESVKEFKSIELLQSAKFLMINGELDKAKILLKEATLSNDFSKKIQLRYLAMIHFIEGNYKLAGDIYSRSDMQEYTAKSRYCTLHVITLLILNKNKQAKNEYKSCRELIITKSDSNLLWLDTLVSLKVSPDKVDTQKIFENIFVENLSGENLRVYLKLAMYLNRQNLIIPRFQYFNSDTLADPLYRELIGMNYYRNLDLVKAYQILESSDDPNAEVFKGNILLLQKRFEAAYAQYKLALIKKDNSTNSLERLIPLAWQLEQWNEGSEFIKKFKFTKAERIYELTLSSAFLTMQNENKLVEKRLKEINSLTKSGDPIEVTQLKAFNAFKLNKYTETEFNSYRSCLKKDALHCWLLYSLVNWDDATSLFQQDREIHGRDLASFSGYFESIDKTPLSEEVFVNQKDIEELDNDLINLLEIE